MKNLNLNLLTSNKKEVSNFFDSFKTVAEKEEALKECIRFLLFNFTLFTQKNKKLVFNFIKKYIDKELKFKDFLEFGCDKNTEKVKSFHIDGYENNIFKNYKYYVNLMLEIDKNYFEGPWHDLKRDFYLIEGLLKIFIDYYNLEDDDINNLILKLKPSCISSTTRDIEEINIEDKIYSNIEKDKIFLIKFLIYILHNKKLGLYFNYVKIVIPTLILIEDNIQLKKFLFCLLKSELESVINFQIENQLMKYLFLITEDSEDTYNFTNNQFEEFTTILENYNKKYIDIFCIEKFTIKVEEIISFIHKIDEQHITISFIKDLTEIIGV